MILKEVLNQADPLKYSFAPIWKLPTLAELLIFAHQSIRYQSRFTLMVYLFYIIISFQLKKLERKIFGTLKFWLACDKQMVNLISTALNDVYCRNNGLWDTFFWQNSRIIELTVLQAAKLTLILSHLGRVSLSRDTWPLTGEVHREKFRHAWIKEFFILSFLTTL